MGGSQAVPLVTVANWIKISSRNPAPGGHISHLPFHTSILQFGFPCMCTYSVAYFKCFERLYCMHVVSPSSSPVHKSAMSTVVICPTPTPTHSPCLSHTFFFHVNTLQYICISTIQSSPPKSFPLPYLPSSHLSLLSTISLSPSPSSSPLSPPPIHIVLTLP